MIVIVFLWGVNMDSDAQDKPDEDITAAGTSNCETRETVATGEELKEKLEMMKLHEMLADPHPEEEAISKI